MSSTVLSAEIEAILKSGSATVSFEDHGQDFLRWHIKDLRVVGCEPCQSWLWCGVEIRFLPVVGECIAFCRDGGKVLSIAYPIAKVEAFCMGGDSA